MSNHAPVRNNPLKSNEHRAAIIVYATIFVTFLSLCTTAVLVTMNLEKQKTGFRPIETTQPISFIDQTYVKKSDAPQD